MVLVVVVVVPAGVTTVAKPAVLMVATAVAEDCQVAVDVTLAVVLSVYVAVAVNWTALLVGP